MSKSISLEPPSFVSDEKSYSQYKSDLEMWSRISGIDKKIQAEHVVYRLDSRLKEKVVTQIGDKIRDNADGIKELLEFLDTIYDKDDMADVWDKFSEFSNMSRRADQDINQFMADWSNSYHKLKATGCEYPDKILGFKLLEAANLNDMERNLVLTGVDFAAAKTEKTLEKQVSASLKKFKGRSILCGGENNNSSLAVKAEPTWVAEIESVFLAKGWQPPEKKGSRRRSRSESPIRSRNPNYRGRKNALGEDKTPLKCYLCKCEHQENCNCPCRYHFADSCPSRKSAEGEAKMDLGLFMRANFSDDDLVL